MTDIAPDNMTIKKNDKNKNSKLNTINNEDKLKQGIHTFSSEDDYIYPDDPILREAISDFSDLKLGFMMHFSPATQLGIVESWALSRGDAAWSRRDADFIDEDKFNQVYFDLYKTFNPLRFSAEDLADLAASCGFKYLLFTTKHHDGFCMYDSLYTDYKISNKDCPYSSNENFDICKNLFDAFRNKGLKISAYYSKADWHHESYWDPNKKIESRNVNYDISKNQEQWNDFVEFTHNQFDELMRNYGPIDALWLDAGWVHKDNKGQDLRLDEIVPKLRKKYNNKLLLVDRTCGGEYENILTPEQSVPNRKIYAPWESCITLGENFSFSYNEKYKSLRDLISTFIEILSKGGNLALNVTPMPDGSLPRKAVHLLRQFGRFVNENSEAIYGSTISDVEPYENWRFVNKGNFDYAFFIYRTEPHFPKRVFLPSQNKVIKNIRCLRTGQSIPTCNSNGDIVSYNTCLTLEDRRYGTWIDTSKLDMLYAEAAECFCIEYDE